MALIRSFFTVGVATMGSRVAGFARDVLMAKYIGAGPVADAFVVAFRLPNLFRRLFAEGAFNSAFVPLFAKANANEGEARARIFAEDVLAVLFTALAVLTALSMIFMPALVWVMAPGFAAEPQKFDDTVLFSRICFVYLMCMSLIALVGGVLNSVGRFAAAAWAPVLLSLMMSAALLIVGFLDLGATREAGIIISFGVALSGVAQLFLLAFAASRAGWSLELRLPRLTPDVMRMIKLGVPGVIAGGITQINLVVGTIIASGAASAVSWLYFADRIYQLPLGIVGVAIGVVLLPELARQLREGDERVGHTQNRAFELSMALTLPASVALAVVPYPIISVLFERGAFTAADSQAVAAALAGFALGLPGFVLIKVLSPGFFAREDTKTPMWFAIASVVVNVAASFALFPLMGHVGIAVATTLAGWVNAVLLWAALARRGHFVWDQLLTRRLAASLVASLAMGIVLVGLWYALGPYLAAERSFLIKGLALSVLCGSGLAVYFALLWVLGGVDHVAFKEALARRRDRGAQPVAAAD